jgi:hypothetical protein
MGIGSDNAIAKTFERVEGKAISVATPPKNEPPTNVDMKVTMRMSHHLMAGACRQSLKLFLYTERFVGEFCHSK